MSDKLDELSTQVAKLTQTVLDLQSRVTRLEAKPRAAVLAPMDDAATAQELKADLVRLDAAGNLTLAGRTLIAFGFAYLLRAITDSHVVSPSLGAGLGLGLAFGLLVLAGMDARRSRAASANYHGFAATAVAFPLIFEATTRLHLLSPLWASVTLCLFSAFGLAIARRGELVPLGWFIVCASLASSMVLLRLTGNLLPFAASTLVLAFAVEALAPASRLSNLRWVTAVGSNLVLLYLAFMAIRPGGLPEEFTPLSLPWVVLFELSLSTVYLQSVGVTALGRKLPLSGFEILQGALGPTLGIVCAARVLTFMGASTLWLSTVALLLGGVSYYVAFTKVASFRPNFRFFSWLGLLLVLVGTHHLWGTIPRALVWTGLGVLAIFGSRKRRTDTAPLHGAVLLGAATVASGLVGMAADGFVGSATADWRPLTAPPFLVTFAAMTCYAILMRSPQGEDRSPSLTTAKLLLAIASLLGIACPIERILAHLVAHAPSPSADPAMLAAARTFLIASTAVALAAAGRRAHTFELRWLVPPLMVAGAAKLVVEDLPHGRPSSEFLTLAFYGTALFLVPRLLRRGRKREGSGEGKSHPAV